MTFTVPITKSDWVSQGSLKESIEGIEKQEKELQFTTFTAKQAGSLVQLITTKIQELEKEGGENQSFSALTSIRLWSGLILAQSVYGEGVGPTNEDWARKKANTVRTYGISSFLKGRELMKKGKEIDSLGAEYAAHGGAFPITIKGVSTGPIGVIIVSGLDQWQDHHVIVEALKKLLA